MTGKNKGHQKGAETEELLREYFSQAGFFAIRGISVQYSNVELTDVDLWAYERPATLARRRTIIDIKDKQRPQAAERLFFVSGLAKILNVEGIGVATTDKNPDLRALGQKNGVLWIDGEDIKRLKTSAKLVNSTRLTNEEFESLVKALDKERKGQNEFTNRLKEVKSSVGDRFGISSANLAIEAFRDFAHNAVLAHPSSQPAALLLKLSYYAAGLAAAGFDFASSEVALRPFEERKSHMAKGIRFGESHQSTLERLEWAELAVREYVPNGAAVAKKMRATLEAELNDIPADDLAEIIVKASNTATLFDIAKSLEEAAMANRFVSFDSLDANSKGFIGALLDFSGIDRKLFAASVTDTSTQMIQRPNSTEKSAATANPSDNSEPKLDL